MINFIVLSKRERGPDNSNLINTEKAVPTKPANNAYIRYNTPISLAFEDKNHLSNHIVIDDVFIFRLLYLSFLDIIILLLNKLATFLEIL